MQTIDQFINKLISSTINKKTEWSRFMDVASEVNEHVKVALENRRIFTEQGDFDRKYDRILVTDSYGSFVARYRDGWIVLIAANQEQLHEKRNFILAIQNSDTSNVVEINGPQEFQADLNRLSMAIERQVDKADDLIDSFIDDPDK